MATSNTSDVSEDKSSDAVLEYTCTKCDTPNKATHFCPECGVYYCRSCLQFLCDHGVLGRSEIGRWGKDTMLSKDEECLKHPDNRIQMYCSEHDVVCCHLCFALSHRSCTMKYIKDINFEDDTTASIQILLKDLETLRDKIAKMKLDKMQLKETLETCRNNIIQSIADYRRKINDMLDILEKRSMEEINTLTKTRAARLQADLDICNNVEKTLEKVNSKMAKTDDDKSKMFVKIKSGTEWVIDSNKVISGIRHEKNRRTMKYIFHKEIEESCSMYDSLGRLQTDNVLFKVQNRKDYTITVQEDTGKGEIRNIIQMPNGNLVMADYDNERVRQLNTNYVPVNHYKLDANPEDVCCVSDSEVAVSMTNKTIQFLSVGTSMVSTRSISLNHYCLGVAHHDGMLYITDNATSVHVYNLSGTKLQTFSKDTNGGDIFRRSYRIAPSIDGNTLYITDHSIGLITIDKNGKKLAKFESAEIKNADGVCVADDGSVFVSGYSSNNIIQVNETGDKKVADIVLKSAKGPHGLCIDRHNNSKLLVANCTCDEITVFDLEEGS